MISHFNQLLQQLNKIFLLAVKNVLQKALLLNGETFIGKRLKGRPLYEANFFGKVHTFIGKFRESTHPIPKLLTT